METPLITKIMFGNESFPIEASDGKRIISSSENIARIGSNFKKFGLDKPSQSTKKINVVIHEVTVNGTFFEIFSGINQNLSKLVLTMAQIILFCEDHHDKLRQRGFGNFFLTEKKLSIFQKICKFLFNKKTEYFVVYINVHSNGLGAHVDRLEDGYVWSGGCGHRAVSPQLIPSVA